MLEQLLSFAGVGVDRAALAAAVDTHAAAIAALALPFGPASASASASTSTPASTSTSAAEVRRAASAAVASELRSSDNLQRWPCHDFRPIFDSNSPSRRLPYSARTYAANCSDPSVVCSVKFDRGKP